VDDDGVSRVRLVSVDPERGTMINPPPRFDLPPRAYPFTLEALIL
jgi:hypothetical protein